LNPEPCACRGTLNPEPCALNPETIAERLLDYPESEWDQLITEWCVNDSELKNKVEEIARQNRNARNFVENLQKRIYTLAQSSLSEEVPLPDEIAGYKVLQKLGSGGSATVYLVELFNGDKAALKLLHHLPSDPYSRHRFEEEQRILATLDHPDISRLLEGGFTESGEPYVVMELATGIPIDRYCIQNQLSVNKRLLLFQAVCSAVNYAHQKLVVHRDLKPDHILVSKDGQIKVIDFGIAKLLEPNRSQGTVFHTRTGMRFMTPEYASPEQIRGEAISTASDIYSLGVLLYLLLTGKHPYRFQTTSMLEVERLVCIEELSRPSSTVQKCTISELENAGYRHIQPKKLKKLLSGDLDRIVLKAMSKSPSERYSSPLAFSDDLENYLTGQPVKARPHTLRYRTRKFIARNRWTIAAVSILILTLTSGLIGSMWQSHQTKIYAEEANTQAQIAGQVTDFLVSLFEAADPGVTLGNPLTIDELLERGTTQALDGEYESSVQLHLLTVLGRVYNGMGIHDKSAELFEAALEKARNQQPEDPLLVADLQSRLGYNMRIMGNLSAADSLYRLALDNRRSVLGEDDPLSIRSLDEWVGVHAYRTRDTNLADSLFQEVVNRRRASLVDYDQDFAESLNNLAYIKMIRQEYHPAIQLYEESAEIYREVLGNYHPERLRTLSSLAVAYHRAGNYGRSEQLLNILIDARIAVLGESHPQVAVSYHHLTELLKDTGRMEQAVSTIEKADMIMQNLSAPHQFHPDILLSKAKLYEQTGKTDLAFKTYQQTGEKCSEIRGAESPGCLRIYQLIGEFFLDHNFNREARFFLQQAFDGYSNRLDPESEQLKNLALMLDAAHQNDSMKE